MTRSTVNVSALITATLTALGFIGVANAATPGAEPHSETISYSDLNLGRPADAAQLYARIERAAVDVCRSDLGSYAAAHALSERPGIMRRCVTQAVDNAVVSVSDENLTALHMNRAERRSVVASSR